MLPTTLKKDLEVSPIKMLLYGPAKSGKTTLTEQFADAANQVYPLILDFEGGANHLSNTYVLDCQAGDPWENFRAALKEIHNLGAEKLKQTYSAICVDSLTSLVFSLETYICKTLGVKTIGDIPFGKGYETTVKELLKPIKFLLSLPVDIVLIGHEKTVDIIAPNGTSTTKFVPSIQDRYANPITQYVDAVLRISFVNGQRSLTLPNTANAIGGCRVSPEKARNMPKHIPLDIPLLKKILDPNASPVTPEEVEAAYKKQANL